MPQDPRLRHQAQGKIVQEVERVSAETVAAFSYAYSGFICDYLGKHGAMHPSLQPLLPGMKLCGPAVTCLGPDYTIRRMAIDLSQAGDVLVVGAGGISEYAVFGDGTARRMHLKGMAGAVVDGATRDALGIRRLGFPTFARAITPRNYHYPVSAEYGAVNVPIVCAGMLVEPGDLIFGDDDGVVVVPRAQAEHLAEEVLAAVEEEYQSEAALLEWRDYGVAKELRERGYEFV
jgi:4-hydroxy-4-methyl-2-oxoglutarate aldolase